MSSCVVQPPAQHARNRSLSTVSSVTKHYQHFNLHVTAPTEFVSDQKQCMIPSSNSKSPLGQDRYRLTSTKKDKEPFMQIKPSPTSHASLRSHSSSQSTTVTYNDQQLQSTKGYEELMNAVGQLSAQKESMMAEIQALKNELVSKQGKSDEESSLVVISQLRIDKERLVDMNQRGMKAHDILFREHTQLKQSHEQLKSLYKQLRIDFQSAIHKQQELYLQLNQQKSKGIMKDQNSTMMIDYSMVNDENVNTGNYARKTSTYTKQYSPLEEQRMPSHRSSSSSSIKKESRYHQEYNSSDILRQLCTIYGVTNEKELVGCATRTEIVVQAVPKLEAIVEEISGVLFENQRKPNKMTIGFDQMLSKLREWAEDIKCIDQFLQFKDDICNSLDLPLDSSTDQDILAAINTLRSRYKNGSTMNNPNKVLTTQSASEQGIMELLAGLGINPSADNSASKISLIHMQLNDLQRFLKVVKILLNLHPDTPHDVTLTTALKYIENACS